MHNSTCEARQASDLQIYEYKHTYYNEIHCMLSYAQCKKKPSWLAIVQALKIQKDVVTINSRQAFEASETLSTHGF